MISQKQPLFEDCYIYHAGDNLVNQLTVIQVWLIKAPYGLNDIGPESRTRG